MNVIFLKIFLSCNNRRIIFLSKKRNVSLPKNYGAKNATCAFNLYHFYLVFLTRYMFLKLNFNTDYEF